jgi:hypothetical protein
MRMRFGSRMVDRLSTSRSRKTGETWGTPGTVSHVKQAQSWQLIFLQQFFVQVLFL